MAITDPAFYINTVGNWPTETYQIAPSASLINPVLGSLPGELLVRFEKEPLNELDVISTPTLQNATYSLDANGQNFLNFATGATISWNLSSFRSSYNIGTPFNFGYVNINPGQAVRNYYAYLLYPYKLFLVPTGVPTKSGANWQINTNTVLISPSSFFFYTSSPALDSYNKHQAYINTVPVVSSLSATSTQTIIYNLCACRTRINNPVITFSTNFNPVYSNIILEPNGGTIRPDSTFITYNVSSYDGFGNINTIGQALPDENPRSARDFKSNYILNYNPSVSNQQIFQLIQNKPQSDTTGRYLGDVGFCVLSAVLNPATSNLKYFSNNYVLNGTTFNNLTGTPGTSIGISYIADCPTMNFTNETWQSTLVSFNNAAGGALGAPVNTTSAGFGSTTWTTKYPPHYYSFKASLSSSLTPAQDTASLTFYLFTSAVSSTTTSVLLSSYIISDYNFIQYDLWNNGQQDYIKFTPTSNTLGIFLSSVQCYYGPSRNIPYSLFSSPWVPASAANTFLVTYPGAPYGEFNLTIRPTLCSVAGYLDAYKATTFNLAAGYVQPSPGSPIFLNLLSESEDQIVVDSSFFTSATGWPTRDLSNSYISWYASPSAGVVIQSVDLSGNYITNIPAGSAVLFNRNTWTTCFSGYGPTTTQIFLSSQKYNESTFLQSNSSLFDIFKYGNLLVGPLQSLNNLNQTRTITLTAQLPYKNRLYGIPPYTPLYWDWTYDGIVSPSTQLISAYNYNIGQSNIASVLSSISLSITPATVDKYSQTHNINVSLYSPIKTPPLTGTYSFPVDDYPSLKALNTDFTAYYAGYTNVIADTRNGINVVTRPKDTTNIFTLSSYTDILPNLDTTGIFWNLSSTNGTSITAPYSAGAFNIDLHNLLGSAIVTLRGSTLAPGWVSAHYVQSQITFYSVNPSDFNQPLSFIIYPQLGWNNSNQVTLLNNSNYTLFNTPTSFDNKSSGSESYMVSANKSFADYIYSSGIRNVQYLKDTSSSVDSLEVPYRTEFYDASGLTISLSASNAMYPPVNGLFYQAPVGGVMTTLNYNITACTTPFNSPYSIPFTINPKIIPYNTAGFSYVVANTSLDLNVNRIISINQTLCSLPSFGPAFAQENNGTITYILSTAYWTNYYTVPAFTGTVNLPSLKTGDAFSPGFINNKSTSLQLQASANLLVQIPPSTFDGYDLYTYSGQRNLWNTLNINVPAASALNLVSYGSSNKIEVYVSSFYNITGNTININYIPEASNNYYVTQFVTDFKENSSCVVSLTGQTVPYSYSNVGTFFLSYSAIYNDGSVVTNTLPTPISISNGWTHYNQDSIRILGENTLSLPHTLEEVLIQPNEWGDADIFNTAITRIQDNLDYIKNNAQTINTDSPTSYFGWLGTNANNLSEGIRWYTSNYGSDDINNPSAAVSQGSSYFSNIKSVASASNYLYVIDNDVIRIFSNGYIPQEITLNNATGLQEILTKPSSLSVDPSGSVLYVCDSVKNKIYRFDLVLDSSQPYFNITSSIGGFGGTIDPILFNTPTQVAYSNNRVCVVDYNNKCVKEYNNYLNWIQTYYIKEFDNDQPIDVIIHPTGIIYILSANHNVYVFDGNDNNLLHVFPLSETVYSNLNKITFDEAGEFIYAITDTIIYKYTAVGLYIASLNIPFNSSTYTSGCDSPDRGILFATSNNIIKIQDLVEIFKIGSGAPLSYWSADQLKIGSSEFATDVNYNRSLVRVAQNLKTFRDSLNSKFVLATEQTNTGLVTYFSMQPINISERPVFDSLIETEGLYVGINEFHIPQVLNRELTRLYTALISLKNILDITNIGNISSTDACQGVFCWSWVALGTSLLALPAIKICNINPVSYAELTSTFELTPAPTKDWEHATSDCCSKYTTPLG